MLRVLIAEDALMIADLLEDVLTASGYEVCGIASSVDEGVALGELHKPDLAVLDVRLARGGCGSEIARRLNSRGKFGVLYATGDNARTSKLTLADGEASIAKPYRAEDIVRALEIVREVATGGTATPPFPPGFRLLSEYDVASPARPETRPIDKLQRQQAALANFGTVAFRKRDLKKVLTEAALVRPPT